MDVEKDDASAGAGEERVPRPVVLQEQGGVGAWAGGGGCVVRAEEEEEEEGREEEEEEHQAGAAQQGEAPGAAQRAHGAHTISR